MSTNLSQQNRDDLLAKIAAIRDYIVAAPQDDKTSSLLTYLSDLERDVNGTSCATECLCHDLMLCYTQNGLSIQARSNNGKREDNLQFY